MSRTLVARTRRALLLAGLTLAVVMTGCRNGEPGPAETPTPTATQAPAGMESFRYDLEAVAAGVFGAAGTGEDATLKINVTGEVAGPEREHITTKMTLGESSVQVERIRVDDRAWTRDSQQPWVEDLGNTTAGSAGIGFDSSALLGPEANARLRSALEGTTPAEERLDGLETLKYRVTAPQLRIILGAPADSPQTSLGRIEVDSTLWVTKDGMLPVRLVTETTPTTGGTVHIEADIRDHNEPIEVKPPAVG